MLGYVKQGYNNDGKTVLYLIFEYMDTYLKKFIRSFCQTSENISATNWLLICYELATNLIAGNHIVACSLCQ